MQGRKPTLRVAAWLIGLILLAACTPRPLTPPTTASATPTFVPATAMPEPATVTPSPEPATMTPPPAETAVQQATPTTPPSPTDDPSAAIERGEAVYQRLVCMACHGQQGEGGVGPTLAKTQLDLEQVIAQVRNPVGNVMPPISGDQASDEEIADVYAYLQSLPLPETVVASVLLAGGPTEEPASATPTATPVPPTATPTRTRPTPTATSQPTPTASTPSADIARGEATFKRLGCNACHGQQGEGSIGPTLAQTQLELERVIGQVRNPVGDVMPPFGTGQVSDDEIGDIYAYLQSLPLPENVVPSVLLSLTPSVVAPGIVRGTVYYLDEGNPPAPEELFIVPAVREGNAVRYLFTTAHLPATQANGQGEFVFEQVEPGTYALFYTYREAEVVDASGGVIVVEVAPGETAIVDEGFIPPR